VSLDLVSVSRQFLEELVIIDFDMCVKINTMRLTNQDYMRRRDVANVADLTLPPIYGKSRLVEMKLEPSI
jgi:hypothetical protein